MQSVAGIQTPRVEKRPPNTGLLLRVSHRTDLVTAFQQKSHEREAAGSVGAECWICHCPSHQKCLLVPDSSSGSHGVHFKDVHHEQTCGRRSDPGASEPATQALGHPTMEVPHPESPGQPRRLTACGTPFPSCALTPALSVHWPMKSKHRSPGTPQVGGRQSPGPRSLLTQPRRAPAAVSLQLSL